ncbi:MAG: YlzJ-like family protein [Ruminiclostridium sp.]
MPIYSIISDYDIFRTEEQPEKMVKQVEGGTVEYIKVNGQYRLNRLFSTNPQMYLDKRYQPTEYYF